MSTQWQDSPPPGGGGAGGMRFAMPSLTPMVRQLIKLNAVIFLVVLLLDILPGTSNFAHGIQVFGGITPRLWIDMFPFVPIWQLLTWGFLHSVTDLGHILMNMLFLFFLGTMLEGMIGSRRFLVVYIGGLLVSGVFTLVLGLGEEFMLSAQELERHYAAAGAGVSKWMLMSHTVGASGAVMTIVVAMAALRPRMQMIFIIIPMTLKVMAIIYVGFDLFGALRGMAGDSSNVAHFAHLAGASWGYLIVRKGWIYRDPLESLQQKQAERASQRVVNDRHRLDELLERIHKQGIGTLSRSEREFMKRASKRD